MRPAAGSEEEEEAGTADDRSVINSTPNLTPYLTHQMAVRYALIRIHTHTAYTDSTQHTGHSRQHATSQTAETAALLTPALLTPALLTPALLTLALLTPALLIPALLTPPAEVAGRFGKSERRRKIIRGVGEI